MRLIVLFFMLISSAHAVSSFPRGCEVKGFGYEGPYLILNETGQQAYFLIQNHAAVTVELERRAQENSFMSPPLHVSLEPNLWGAFASDVAHLQFTCYQHIGEEVSVLPCSQVLDVCQYPRARFALSNMGNYWISANHAQQDVIQESVAKGIYLKW